VLKRRRASEDVLRRRVRLVLRGLRPVHRFALLGNRDRSWGRAGHQRRPAAAAHPGACRWSRHERVRLHGGCRRLRRDRAAHPGSRRQVALAKRRSPGWRGRATTSTPRATRSESTSPIPRRR